ncbi:MAG: NAD(P)-binding protein, partial [Sphaerospermopsis kisseleviana]
MNNIEETNIETTNNEPPVSSKINTELTISETPAEVEIKSEPEYDYVVVGSGAGGGPLAANLAKAGYKVLLLEAGGDPLWDDNTNQKKE